MPAKFAKENFIRLLDNDEGVAYGPENNPKRSGSKAAERFNLYRDGMTVEEAQKLGIGTADINYDIEHGYINVNSVTPETDV